MNKLIALWLSVLMLLMTGCTKPVSTGSQETNAVTSQSTQAQSVSNSVSSSEVEQEFQIESNITYTGDPYVVINNNEPYFTDEEKASTEAFENYSQFDSLGRCGIAFANICQELMPEDKRESISSVKPTGWQSTKYDFIGGKYLYNRCHLIGFQLAGENANAQNLITGTRYLNIDGMLPFENLVADYVKETNNHVLYRVTPVYTGDNLVADGLYMEGWSVEDEGDGVCYNVYCFNVQPGVVINYKDGTSSEGNPIGTVAAGSATNVKKPEAVKDNSSTALTVVENSSVYILNTNSKKFHTEGCSETKRIKKENKETFNGTREELISDGYEPCGKCKP